MSVVPRRGPVAAVARLVVSSYEASEVVQPAELTPENAALLAKYADHLQHSPLTGHSPRTYLGAVRAYLAWLEQAPADGDPLNDATAKDWAVRDYRSYLVTVAKRARPR